MWNGADNRVATMKTSNIGKKTETEAILEVKSSPSGFYADEGNYAYYAAIKEHAALLHQVGRDDHGDLGEPRMGPLRLTRFRQPQAFSPTNGG